MSERQNSDQPALFDCALRLVSRTKLAPLLAVLLVPLIMAYALVLIVHATVLRPGVVLWKAVSRSQQR